MKIDPENNNGISSEQPDMPLSEQNKSSENDRNIITDNGANVNANGDSVKLVEVKKDIPVTFLHPVWADARTCKTIKRAADGTVTKVNSYSLGTRFKSTTVRIGGLSGLAKQFRKMDEQKAIRIYGNPIIKNDPDGIYERKKINFPEPDNVKLLMLDADNWEISKDLPVNIKDKNSIKSFLETYLRTRIPYLCNRDVLCCFSNSAAVDDNGNLVGPFKAHLYYIISEPLTLQQIREWSANVNNRVREKILDGSVYRSVQPDYFQPPTYADGAADAFGTSRRILLSGGNGGVPVADMLAERNKFKDCSFLDSQVQQVENWADGDSGKGGNWLQACSEFGKTDCHEVEIRAAAKMVFEIGGAATMANLDLNAQKLHDKCWSHYGNRDGGSRYEADKQTYTLAQFRQALESAAVGAQFGYLHDSILRQWSSLASDEILSSEAVALLMRVRYVKTWSGLRAKMESRFDGRLHKGAPGKDALKRVVANYESEQRRVDTGDEEIGSAGGSVPEQQFNILTEKGFEFFVDTEGRALVEVPGHSHAVSCEDEKIFMASANRYLITGGSGGGGDNIFGENTDSDILLTQFNRHKFMAYLAGTLIGTDRYDVSTAVRVFRDHVDNCVWLDHGDGGRVYKISDNSVEIIGRKDCPIKFMQYTQAPFPEVSQAEIDAAIEKARVVLDQQKDRIAMGMDSFFWEANREILSRGNNIPEEEVKTCFAFIVYCMLNPGEYPILHLIGDSNSGKSFSGSTIQWGFEPRYGSTLPRSNDRLNHNKILGAMPGKLSALAIQGASQYAIGADNLNNGKQAEGGASVLDKMTTAVTGISSVSRKHYSQSENVTFSVCAPIIATGTGQLVDVPREYSDLLKRIYPISVVKSSDRKRMVFREVVEGKGACKARKNRFLETLAAAAVCFSLGLSGGTSHHRIGAFGTVMDHLFPGLDNWWWKCRFSKLERIVLDGKAPWLSHVIDIVKKKGSYRGTSGDIAVLHGLKTDSVMHSDTGLSGKPAAVIGTFLRNHQPEIESVYEVKIKKTTVKGNNTWTFEN